MKLEIIKSNTKKQLTNHNKIFFSILYLVIILYLKAKYKYKNRNKEKKDE